MKLATRNTMRFIALVTLGFLLIPCASFAADQVFQQSYPLVPGGTFFLENVNGSVLVDGWDRNEVEVRAVKKAEKSSSNIDQVMIDVDSQPGQVTVHTRYPQGQTGDVAVEYHIYVPNRVLLRGVGTVNGSVLVRGVSGGGELRSVNGNVEVLDSSGRFSAKTTNGDLHLELQQLNDGAPMDIETVNGSVMLGLPSDAGADLTVLNMNGNFSSELPVTPTTGSFTAREFRAKLGMGGGEICVRTVNGAIHLVRERSHA